MKTPTQGVLKTDVLPEKDIGGSRPHLPRKSTLNQNHGGPMKEFQTIIADRASPKNVPTYSHRAEPSSPAIVSATPTPRHFSRPKMTSEDQVPSSQKMLNNPTNPQAEPFVPLASTSEAQPSDDWGMDPSAADLNHSPPISSSLIFLNHGYILDIDPQQGRIMIGGKWGSRYISKNNLNGALEEDKDRARGMVKVLTVCEFEMRISKYIREHSSQWDILSRRWRQRKNIQTIALLIAAEVHLIGGEVGPTYEIVLPRTRYVEAQMGIRTRIERGAVFNFEPITSLPRFCVKEKGRNLMGTPTNQSNTQYASSLLSNLFNSKG
ncbi:hypothetical protein HHX47_DHR2000547 [Lentinula edodes]|nr:hypothetical protein HHX47_DHR2000547 [Lentinula edodes]